MGLGLGSISRNRALRLCVIALATSPYTKGTLEFLKCLLFRRGLLSMPIQTLSLFVRALSLNNDGALLEKSKNCSKPEEARRIANPQDYIPDIELIPLATSPVDDLEEPQTSLFQNRRLLHPSNRATTLITRYSAPRILQRTRTA